MDTVSPRAVTSLVVLAICVAASFRATKVEPVHTVTEIASVVFVPPRAPGTASLMPREVTALAASGTEQAPMQPPAAQPTDLPKPGPLPQARTASWPDMPAAAARPPRHRLAARVARAGHSAAAPRPGAGRNRLRGDQLAPDRSGFAAVPQPLPLFVPLQQLGLAIQAKLGTAGAQHPAAHSGARCVRSKLPGSGAAIQARSPRPAGERA